MTFTTHKNVIFDILENIAHWYPSSKMQIDHSFDTPAQANAPTSLMNYDKRWWRGISLVFLGPRGERVETDDDLSLIQWVLSYFETVLLSMRLWITHIKMENRSETAKTRCFLYFRKDDFPSASFNTNENCYVLTWKWCSIIYHFYIQKGHHCNHQSIQHN